MHAPNARRRTPEVDGRKLQAEGFTISHLGAKKILGGNQPVKVAENSKRRVNGPLVR
jgi:hypothetical protein